MYLTKNIFFKKMPFLDLQADPVENSHKIIREVFLKIFFPKNVLPVNLPNLHLVGNKKLQGYITAILSLLYSVYTYLKLLWLLNNKHNLDSFWWSMKLLHLCDKALGISFGALRSGQGHKLGLHSRIYIHLRIYPDTAFGGENLLFSYLSLSL